MRSPAVESVLAATSGLRQAFGALFASVGLDRPRMSDLRERFELDKSVASRMSRALRSVDDGAALREMPGTETLQRLVSGCAGAGADAGLVEAARAAVGRLDAAIAAFPGDRPALDAAVRGAGAESGAEHAARRGAYDAFQSAQGIACETTSCITILGPGTSPGALDQAMVIATTGLRRLRRGNPYAVLSLQGNPGTGHVCERTNLSGAPLLDDPTVALIPEFCSPAASRLLLERRGKYLSLVLGPTVPPLEQPMDLAYGLVNLSFESSRATADHCWTMTSYTVSRACKLHVREVLLHRATFGSAAPEAVFTVESVPPLRPEADGPDRTGRGAVDHGARFVSMGAGYSQRGRSEEDFVVPMGLKALELLGRDPADYERHRMVVEYPLPFVRGESWVRLPQ